MAKIPFSIDYKPQIESGEYKVKTRFGEPVEIVKWDCRGEYPILACIFDGDTDDSAFFSNDGKGMSGSEDVLYIITPEPELTDFEKKLWEVLKSEGSPIGPIEKFTNADKEVFHSYAAELLAIAKEECKNQIKNDYREIIHGAYEKGMKNALKDLEESGRVHCKSYDIGYDDGARDALKDLPRWRKIGRGSNYSLDTEFIINGRYLEMTDTLNDVFEVALSELEKLPKEDETKQTI